MPVGRAVRACCRSRPHSGMVSGRPRPRKPRPPRTSTASAALSVSSTGTKAGLIQSLNMGWEGLSPRHCQQSRDVVHHCLHSGSNRPEPSQPQQVQGGSTQRGHHAGAIAAVAVGILVELGVADPVPALVAARLLRSSCSSGLVPVAAGLLGWCAGW